MGNLGIEDLVMNSLIEKIEQTGKRFVTTKEVADYENALRKYYNDRGIEVKIFYYRDLTNQFIYEYSDIIDWNDDANIITLKKGVSSSTLVSKFRGYLPLDMLMGVVDSEVTKCLLDKEEL